jgi:acyl carrier protein
VHAAGLPGGGIVARKTREAAARVLAPKLRGGLVLDELLRARCPDFLVLCSSLASVLGGAAQVDYVAANAFLDALARRNTASGGIFTVAIGYDTWTEAGMAVDADLPPDLAEARRLGSAYGIRTAEGVEAFARVLDEQLPHVVTSTLPLESRRERPAASSDVPEHATTASNGHPRPVLASAPVAPRNELEEVIARLWQEMLGFDGLGVDDDFFELGGHSLLATRIVNRLRESFQVALKLETFFDSPTVARLAAAIEERDPRARDVAAVLLEVERLSPEELGARLAADARPEHTA